MSAHDFYFSSILASFSTFLETSAVPNSQKEAATRLLQALLQWKNDYSVWDLQEVDVFYQEVTSGRIAFREFPIQDLTVPLRLLKDFVNHFPPYQISVYLHQYLLALKEEGCSASTLRNYRSDINQFWQFSHSHQLAQLITKPVMSDFVGYEQQKGLQRSSIRRKVASISQFGLWAQRMGLIHDVTWLKDPNLLENIEKELVFKGQAVTLTTAPASPLPPLPLPIPPSTLPNLAIQKPTQPPIRLPKNHLATAQKLQEKRAQFKAQLDVLSQRIRHQSRALIAPYLTVAMIVLFFLGLGIFGYQQLIVNAPSPLAYPGVPTSPNRILSFQGRLTDTAQNPVTSATDMQFELYNSGPGVGGTLLWDSGTCSITPDQDGIFSVGLGANPCGTAITEDVFTENTNVWLQVSVESETLTPRQPIRTVPYALNSETIQGYPISATGAATVNTVLTMDSGGDVVLGEVGPELRSVSGEFTITGQSLLLQTQNNGDIILDASGIGGVISRDYIHAPGATLSATYAEGIALTLLGGPTGTANITEWRNNAGGLLANISAAGGFTTADDIAVNGGDITTTATTANIFNTDATTLNIGGAATTLNLGAASGTTTINNDLNIDGTLTSTSLNTPGGIVYAQSGGLLGVSSAGTSGECLLSGGAGTPTFGSCATAVADSILWQESQGTAQLKNTTLDLLVGGTSTASAKFAVLNVNSGTPTATISGSSAGNALSITGDGNIATSLNRSLILNPSGGNVGIGTSNPTQKLTVAGNIQLGTGSGNSILTFNSTSMSINRGNVQIYSANGEDLGLIANNTGYLFFRTSATERMRITSGGNIGIGTSNPGAKLQINTEADATIGQIIQANSGSQTANLTEWRNSSGTPLTVVDEAGKIGIGVSNPNVELQISDTQAAIGLTSTADNFTEVIATNTPAGVEARFGTSNAANSYGLVGTNTNHDFVIRSNNTERIRIKAGGNVGIGTNNPISLLSVGSGSPFQVNSSGAIAAATGITSSGTITFSGLNTAGGIVYTNGSGVLGTSAAGTTGECLLSGGTGAPTFGSCATAVASSILWQESLGTAQLKNTTLDLLVGGTSTASAKFAVLNVNSGTPTASISGNSGNIASYLTGDGTLATSNRQTLTLGNSSTYNTTGNILLQPAGGRVGIGTTAPNDMLALGNTTTGGSMTFNGPNNSATTTVQIAYSKDLFGTDVSGLNFSGANRFSGIRIKDSFAGSSYINLTQGSIAANWDGPNTNTPLNILRSNQSRFSIYDDVNLNDVIEVRGRSSSPTALGFTQWARIGINTTAPTAQLFVRGAYGGNDAFTVDQRNSGNILTASASGTTRFVITNAGDVGIGTTTPASLLSVGSSSQFQVDSSGNITSSTLNTPGGVIYAQSGGLLAASAAGTTGECLLSGGTGAPTFGSCATAVADSILWQQVLGTAQLKNTTLDLLVGGTSTASAKFAVLNINSGTPTASIAGSTAGSALSLSGEGVISTTINRPLQINPNGGRIGIGTSSPSYQVDIRGSSNQMRILSTGAGDRASIILERNLSGAPIVLASEPNTVQGFIVSNNPSNIYGGRIFQVGQNGNTAIGAGVTANSNATLVVGGGTAIGGGTFLTNTPPSSGLMVEGNVGIGTTTTRAALDIAGSASLSGTLAFRGTTDPKIDILNGENFGIRTSPGGSTSLTERLTVLNSGNVGIGTTAPNDLLSLRYSGGNGNINLDAVSGSNSVGIFFSGGNNFGLRTNGDGLNFVTGTSGSNTTRLVLDSSGSLGIGTNTPAALLSVGASSQFQVDSSGNITSSTLNTPGGVIYAQSGGLLAASAAGSAGQCLVSGGTGTPTWTSCSGASSNYWRLSSGAVSPINDTLDLLIGSNATSSAKFAFMNVNSGTPTASISGSSAGNALSITGDGTIATSLNRSLILNPSGGNVGIGTTAPGAIFQTYQNTNTLSEGLRVSNNGMYWGTGRGVYISLDSGDYARPVRLGAINDGGHAFFISTTTAGGSTIERLRVTSNGNVGIGTTVPSQPLDVIGNIRFTGQTLGPSGSSSNPSYSFSSEASSGLYRGGTADVRLAVTGTNVITALGSGRVGIGTTVPQQALDVRSIITVRGPASTGWMDFSNDDTTGSFNIGNTSNSSVFALILNGSHILDGYQGNIGIGTTAPIGKLEVTGTPGAGGNALAIFNSTSTSTDILTASASGTPRFVITNPGNVGIGTTAPAAALSVGSSSQFQVDSSGNITSSTLNTPGGIIYAQSGGLLAASAAGSLGQCLVSGGTGAPTWTSCSGASSNYWRLTSGALSPINDTTDLLLGSSATSSAKFAFLNVNSGTPTASIAGSTTGNALSITGDGTIATSLKRSLILNPSGGNVGIGTTNPTTLLDVSGNAHVNGTLRIGTDVNKGVITYTTNILSFNTYGANSLQLNIDTATIGSWGPGGNSVLQAAYAGSGNPDRAGVGLKLQSGQSTGNGIAGPIIFEQSPAGSSGSSSNAYTEVMRIDTSGNLGIGTSTPTQKLEVTGNILSSQSGSSYLSVNSGSGSSNINLLRGLASKWLLQVGAADDLNFLEDSTDSRLYLLEGGNIGIGSTAPAEKLDVRGNIALGAASGTPTLYFVGAGNTNYIQKVNTNILATDARWRVSNGTVGAPSLSFTSDAASGLYLPTTSEIGLATAGVERIRIDSTGQVGIGTTTPAALLSVGASSQFQVDTSGNITSSTLNTPGGVIYAQSGGLLAVSAAGTIGECLTSGGTGAPTWASCSSSSASYWRLASGALSPINDTTDLLIGSAATSSAKFAFINVNSGTPTASISGSVAGNNLFITGDGTITTSLNRSLILNPSGGNVGIGTTNPTSKLELVGDSTSSFSVKNSTGDSLFLTDTTNGTVRFQYLGGATPTDGIVIKKGAPDVGGRSEMLISGTGPAWTGTKGIIFRNHLESINISANTRFTATNGVAIGILWAGASDINQVEDSMIIRAVGGEIHMVAQRYASSPYPPVVLSAPSFEIKTKIGAAWTDGGGAAATSYGTTRFIVKDSGLVGIGTTTPTAPLFVQGTYSNSDAFTVNQQNSGNILTASASGTTKFTLANNGDIVSTGAISGLTGITSSGNITFSGLNTPGGIIYAQSGGLLAVNSAGTTGQCLLSGGAGTPTWSQCVPDNLGSKWNIANGALSPINATLDLLVGGTSTASAKFAVLNINSGTPTATIAGSTNGNAVSITGDGIIATSNNRSLILNPNGGRIGIGTTNPLAQLDVVGSADITQFQVKANATQSNSNPLIKAVNSSNTELFRLHSDSIDNLFIGKSSGLSNTVTGSGSEGLYNTFVGSYTGDANTTGYQNVAVGHSSLGANTSGFSNIGVGPSALLSNTTGISNVALGDSALRNNVSGNYNMAIGGSSLNHNATGSANVAIGAYSGWGTTGLSDFSNNTLIGYQAGYSLLTNGSNNTLIGYQAGDNLTTGSSNIIIGHSIDAPAATTTQSLIIGNLLYGTGLTGTGTTISGGGRIGIGTSAPSSALDVTTTANGGSGSVQGLRLRLGNDFNYSGNNQILFSYDESTSFTHAIKTRHRNSAAAGNAIDFYLWNYGVDSDSTIGTKHVLTLDGTGNVGIGTTTPASPLYVHGTYGGNAAVIFDQRNNGDILTASASGTTRMRLDTNGYIYSQRFTDIANSSFFLDPAASGDSLVIAGDITLDSGGTIQSTGGNNIDIDAGGGTVMIGGGTGKFDAGTIDPPYWIEGKGYATYVSSMIGLNEEIAQVVNLQPSSVPGVYKYVIDFANLNKNSQTDMWLFSRITAIDPDMSNLAVLVSSHGDNRVAYKKDPAKQQLIIFGNQPGEVTIRLTAPRYNAGQYQTVRTNQDGRGFRPGPKSFTVTAGGVSDADLAIALGQPTWTVTSLGQLQINGSEPSSVLVTDTNGSIVTQAEALAAAVIGQLRTGFIQTQQLLADRITTNRLSVNQKIETPEINTNLISPVSGNDVTIGLKSAQNGQDASELQVKNDQNQTVTTIDSQGNAEFAGQVKTSGLLADLIETETITSDQVTTASVSATQATLTEADITSARIQTLEARMADLQAIRAQTADIVNATVSGTLYADDIYAFEDKVATALQAPSLLSQLMGQVPQASSSTSLETLYQIVDNDLVNASGSGSLNKSLADLNLSQDDVSLGASAIFINQYFELNGSGYIAGSLGINESLLVGTGTRLADGQLEYILADNPSASVLKLQPSGVGSIDLLAGKMTINQDGNVTINGNLNVAGEVKADTLLSNLLKPGDFTNPFQVQVAGASTESGEIQKSRFEIINELGAPVATISAEGKADFAGGIGVGTQDLGDAQTADADKPSGKATVVSGSQEVTINSRLITDKSLVYITPVGSTGNQVLYVKSQTPDSPETSENEGRFTVGFDSPTTQNVQFNWWIVN